MSHAAEQGAPANSSGLSFEGLATGLLLVSAFAVGCLMPVQNDTWWHLRVGQEILRLRAVPLEDFLSYTATGRPWPNHEWLSQVIFLGAHRLGGMPLLQALAAVVVTAAYAVAATLMAPRFRPLALALVLPLSASGWAVRPHLFTVLFLALTLRLLVRGGAGWLALLFPVWANLHSGVVIAGPVLCGALLVAFLRDRRRLPLLCALLVAWALGTMATPLGPRLFGFVVANLSSPVAREIVEWRPASFSDPIALLFILEAAALIGLTMWQRRRRLWSAAGPHGFAEDFLLLVALMFVPLALRSVRHIGLAALALAPALAAALAGAACVARQRKPSTPDKPLFNLSLLALAAAGALGLVLWAWSRPLPRLGWQPMSPAAAAAIASCPHPLYNRYDDGGYLLWFVPSRKVFLDSRHDPYPHSLMLEQLRVDRTAEHRALFDRYRFRCAVLPPENRLGGPLRAEGWRASFQDGEWLVLVAPDAGAASPGLR